MLPGSPSGAPTFCSHVSVIATHEYPQLGNPGSVPDLGPVADQWSSRGLRKGMGRKWRERTASKKGGEAKRSRLLLRDQITQKTDIDMFSCDLHLLPVQLKTLPIYNNPHANFGLRGVFLFFSYGT